MALIEVSGTNVPLSPETLRWFFGLILFGLGAGLVLLVRIALFVGDMRGKVTTLWDDWLFYKRKFEEESGRDFRQK